MENDYLQSVRKQFEYYKLLGDKTIAQVTDEQLFWQYNEESNSIATIAKHLWGKYAVALDGFPDDRRRKRMA
jgi:hypothetical protein